MPLRNKTDCTCPGDTLTFECAVMGKSYGLTVWTGSVFSNCLAVQEIVLFHSDIGANGASTLRKCSYIHGNVSIVAQGLRVENGSYISQLNVTVTSDVIGKSIECLYDNQINTTTTVGSLNLTLSGKIVTAATGQRLLLYM